MTFKQEISLRKFTFLAAPIGALAIGLSILSTPAVASTPVLDAIASEAQAEGVLQSSHDGEFLYRAPNAARGERWESASSLESSDQLQAVAAQESLRSAAVVAPAGISGGIGGITDTGYLALCNISTVVLEKFPSKYDGTISLKCGTALGAGLNHILNSHPFSQWRKQMGGDGSVVQYIMYAQRAALKAPARIANQTGNKRCYTTPIQVYKLVNGRPQYVKTWNPTVVVSKNNKIIITSVPTTKSTC